MGKLVWAALGFAAAALAAEYFLPTSGLPYLAAALAVLSLLALLLKGEKRRAAFLLVLSAAAGLLLWWARYELRIAPGEALVGQDRIVTARLTDYPETSDSYTGLPVRITGGAPRGRAYLYTYDSDGALPELAPGDEITVEIRVLSSMYTAGGERRHTHTAVGRTLLGRALGEVAVTGRDPWAWRYFPQELAQRVKELCRALFPAEAAAFETSLLTGDRTDLYADTQLYSEMRAAGVLHIVAVSGMHIVILVSFLQLLLGHNRRSSLVCFAAMIVFVLMAGCGASVVRAALMQTLVLLAPFVEREYDGPSSLSAALLAILLVNPMAIGGAALQLSFACALGFVVFMPRLTEGRRRHRWMERRIPRAVAGSLMCTFCATVFSLPLSAYYFGIIPLYAWLSNLLTLPVVEICFAGGFLVCGVGAVLPSVGAALAWALAWAVRWCAFVYHVVASIPFGCLYTVRTGSVLWLAGTYAVFLVWRLLRRKGKRLRLWIPLELSAIGLCAVLLSGGLSLRSGGELDVLDVGQGQCVVLLDESAAVVVDCGGSDRANAGDTAANWLLSQGKTSVDVLILTHLHEDHTNGAAELMTRLPVGVLILPADHDDEDRMLDGILAAAERRDTTVLFLSEEGALRLGEMTLTLLLPQAGSSENDRGIVVHAAMPELDALVMGDAGESSERALLDRGWIPDVDVLVVGHHGSLTSSGALFLRSARAETAAISVGAANPYGHPADAVIERLTEYGSDVLRTDRDGNITIRPGTEEVLYG